MKKLRIFGYPTITKEVSDQTVRMRRMIWIFGGRTCPHTFSDVADFMCWSHKSDREVQDKHEYQQSLTRLRGYKTFFMLNSAEHEIYFAYKS